MGHPGFLSERVAVIRTVVSGTQNEVYIMTGEQEPTTATRKGKHK